MKGLNPVNKGLINSNWDKCQIRWANVIRPGIDLVCAFKCIQYDIFYKVFCINSLLNFPEYLSEMITVYTICHCQRE